MNTIRKILRRLRESGGTGTVILDKQASKQGSECQAGQASLWGRSLRSGVSQSRFWARKVCGSSRSLNGGRPERREQEGLFMWGLVGIKNSFQVHLEVGKPPECCKHQSSMVRPGLDGCAVRNRKPRVWEGRKLCSSPWERWRSYRERWKWDSSQHS